MSRPVVSVVIPARNEQFLVPTVNNLLRSAQGPVEIIVVLDGKPTSDWPVPDPSKDNRIRLITFDRPIGMRPSINAGVGLAQGKFILKIDGHCAISDGYDKHLSENCDKDWIVVPRRYSLEPHSWTCKPERPAIDAHFLSNPFERPDDPKCGLHGTIWRERTKERKDILIDEEMSSQGSFWFMHKEYWNRRIGPMDYQNYGNFIQEFQELGLKCWLSGGHVMVNKYAWYAHLHKGKEFGRGYFLSKSEQQKGATFATDYWMNDRWPDAIYTMKWFIERFSPVPTWPADLDAFFAPSAYWRRK